VVRGVRFQDGIAIVDPPNDVENNQQKITASFKPLIHQI